MGKSESSCGPTVLIEDTNNGHQYVQFSAVSTKGVTYSQTISVPYGWSPSTSAVGIAGNCSDGLFITYITINGYQYKLKSHTRSDKSEFWVDGDNDGKSAKDDCINGLVCYLCYYC